MHNRALQKLTRVLKKNNMVLLCSGETNYKMVENLICGYGEILKKFSVIILTDIQYFKRKSDRALLIYTKEAKFYKRLYETYEFSNRCNVLSSEDANYGDLLNYVKVGLLTEQEYIQAFLEHQHGTQISQHYDRKT